MKSILFYLAIPLLMILVLQSVPYLYKVFCRIQWTIHNPEESFRRKRCRAFFVDPKGSVEVTYFYPNK